MKYVLIAITLALTACAGVPLTTAMKLRAFNPETLKDADPAQIAIAFNVDANAPPASTLAPAMVIAIKPVQPGDFQPVDATLRMELAPAVPPNQGLPLNTNGRNWLVYRFSAAQIQEMREIQTYFKQLDARKNEIKGGSVSLGFKLTPMRDADPVFANSRLENWVRLSIDEGFFKLWAGKVGELTPKK